MAKPDSMRQQVIAAILDSATRRVRLGLVIERLYAFSNDLPSISATLTSMLLKGEISLTHDRYLELGEVSIGA